MPALKGRRTDRQLRCASQARRRLKGFGHGVRKVQTGGKNQAVIIHTATGRHLEELKMKFADIGYWCREEVEDGDFSSEAR